MELAGWELGCCVPAPQVGDLVAWQLQWTGGSGAGSVRLAWPEVSPDVADGPVVGWRLRLDGLVAWCSAERRAEVPPAGRLVAEHHTGVPHDLTRTAGRVVRVRVVARTYRRVGARSWEAVEGRDVLHDGPLARPGGPGPRDGATTWVTDDALLVTLELP